MMRLIPIDMRFVKSIAVVLFLLFSAQSYAGNTQTKEVNINDTFWLYATSHTGVVGVTWTWDTDCFELISNLYATSGQAQFRAKKMTPSSGAYIQATTRYQLSGAPGSYTDYDDWKIIIKDNTTIDIQSNLTLMVGESYNLSANVSTTPYDGDYQWQTDNSQVVTIIGNSQTVVLKALSEGSAKIRVSLVNGSSAVCDVKVIKQSDDIDKSEYEIVNLGLSVNWASKNIGASSEFEYGTKFAWGEIKSKSNFSVNNSETYNIDIFKSNNLVDSNHNLNLQHDAAHNNMGEIWRMPTDSEFRELLRNCSFTLKCVNSQYYYLITGPSGRSIVMPFDYNGWWSTHYWTSTSQTNIHEAVNCSVSNESPYFWVVTWDRYEGCFIRGVTKESENAGVAEPVFNKPNFQLITESGCLKIMGDDRHSYKIYSVDGTLIRNDQITADPIFLPQGLYIISIENWSSKIYIH